MKTKNKFPFTKVLLILLYSSSVLFSYAQIIYVDIDPDTTISVNGGFFNFNLINDDSAEYQIIRAGGSRDNYVELKILQDSCYLSAFLCEGFPIAHKFFLNDTIGVGNYWWWLDYPQYTLASIAYFCLPGEFVGARDAYLGLKWFNNEIAYYGWVRVDVADDANWFTVKDYAFAPSMLLAGQQSSTYLIDIKDHNLFLVSDYDNFIHVKSRENLKISEVLFLNLLAQEQPVKLNNCEIIIDKQQLSPGLHLLYLKTNKGVQVLKILIK